MKSSRFARVGLVAGAVALVACSDSDTVLSLNVNADNGVGYVSSIHVTVTQGSRAPVERDFSELPTKTVGEAGATQTVLAGGFFERIVLPESWSDGAATVDVESFDEAGNAYLHPDPISVDIEQKETVAVFVTLKLPSAGGEGGGGAASGGTGGVPEAAAGAGPDVAGNGSGGSAGSDG
jgi:hypothetical protein